jgi:tetratricopeptide (TPR) repeat protein
MAAADLVALEKVCRAQPTDARAWHTLGLAFRAEQRMAEAIAALSKSVALAPEDLVTAMDCGQTRHACGLPAADFLCALSKKWPDHLGATRLAAAALESEGYRQQAEDMLEAALTRHPGWLEGHKMITTQRYTAGAVHGFDDSYLVACRSQPRNMALRLAWFYTLVMLRDWPAAARVLDEGEALMGSAQSITLGRLYIACETFDEARAENLLQQTEWIIDAGVDLCRTRYYLRCGRIAQAEATATRLSLGPSSRLAWPYLGIIWRLRGDSRVQWLDGSPPYIRHCELGMSAAALRELAVILRQLHTAQAPYFEQSVRGGTQTNGQLFFRQEPIIQATKKQLIGAIGDYVRSLPPFDDGHPIKGVDGERILFQGSWSVRLQSQGFHVSHTHPMGRISSAFYVSLPDTTRFGRPPAGWIQLGTPPPELGLGLGPYAEVEPRAGRLVLFPSTMWHSTAPFDDGERLAIAFDVC